MRKASRVNPLPKIPGPRQRDWHVQEWLLLAFACGMMLLIYFVARLEADLSRSEIARDAAMIEQSISRRLENDQQFFDRLALDVSGERISAEDFDRIAGQRALESGYVTDVLRLNTALEITRHAPGNRSLEFVKRSRAPFRDQLRMASFAEKTARSTYSQPYHSDTGRYFIEYAAPVFSNETFLGTVNAIVSFDLLLDKVAAEWSEHKYRIIISDAEGHDISDSATNRYVMSEALTHTIPLSLPWRNLQLTLVGAKPSSLLPNLTLSASVLALTGLMVWTLMGLRKQQRMRREAELERDRVYLQSIENLHDNNERFETVLDSLDVSVYVTDMKSNELLYCNDQFRESFPGLEIGQSIDDFERGFNYSAATMGPQQPMEMLLPNAEYGAVIKEEVERPADDRWYARRTRAVRWVDGRIARLTSLGDVTDRVVAEHIREAQQDKLMRTARLMSVGEIASTLAHEINQPLGAIANYVSGCIRRLKNLGNADELVIAAMEKADNQVKRAGAIIGRVREFVRTREPQRKPTNINHLVTEVVKLVESDDEERALACRLDLDESLPLVFADQIMIEQVLVNMLRNAREAMHHLPPQSRIAEIRTSRVDDGYAMVEVADFGVGIPPETAAQLFSPFFTTKSEGMGMGLNICRSLIEHHEGRLTFVENKPTGTIFRFTLPFDEGI